MKKILHVVSSFEYGGTEAFIMNNLRNMDSKKIIFDVYVGQDNHKDISSHPFAKEIIKSGGNIFYGKGLKSKLVFVLSLCKHIELHGTYHAVHGHLNIANFWIVLSAFISGVSKRISHSHATSGKDTFNVFKKLYYKLLELLLVYLSTDILACGVDAGEYLYGKYRFQKYGKVINNGIDVKKFLYVEKKEIDKLRYKYDLDEKNFIVGNITRFDRNKNINFVVDTFYHILKTKKNAVLILGGIDGGSLIEIKDKVDKLGIKEKVRFVGERNDVNIFMNMMDVYIFPSYSEGLAITAIECQAARLNCIASDSITNEIDLGLGLIHFINLNKGEKYWAKYIIEKTEDKKINDKRVIDKFELYGYSIKSSAKELEKIYVR